MRGITTVEGIERPRRLDRPDASRPAADFPGRSPLLRAAYRFARSAHAGQRLKTDGAPYFHHPVAVGALLHEAGFSEPVAAAGLLHDTVEDSEAGVSDIAGRFGDEVGALVAAVTEPAELEPYERRKDAHRRQVVAAGRDAAAIFAADKLVSARNLRGAIAARGEEAVDDRLEQGLDRKLDHYRASLSALREIAPPLPFLAPLEAELRRLDAQRGAMRERRAAQRGG